MGTVDHVLQGLHHTGQPDQIDDKDLKKCWKEYDVVNIYGNIYTNLIIYIMGLPTINDICWNLLSTNLKDNLLLSKLSN